METDDIPRPQYHIGEGVRLKESTNWHVIRAIYWSVPDNCFLYVFDNSEGKAHEYAPEHWLVPLLNLNPVMRNLSYDDDRFNDVNYKYHFEIIEETNIVRSSKYEIKDIVAQIAEKLRFTIKLVDTEITEDVDISLFLSIDETGRPKVDYFLMHELFCNIVALSLYDIGLYLKFWSEDENITQNHKWLEFTTTELIFNETKLEIAPQMSLLQMGVSFHTHFENFRSAYHLDNKFYNSARLFSIRTLEYCHLLEDEELITKLDNMYFSILNVWSDDFKSAFQIEWKIK